MVCSFRVYVLKLHIYIYIYIFALIVYSQRSFNFNLRFIASSFFCVHFRIRLNFLSRKPIKSICQKRFRNKISNKNHQFNLKNN